MFYLLISMWIKLPERKEFAVSYEGDVEQTK